MLELPTKTTGFSNCEFFLSQRVNNSIETWSPKSGFFLNLNGFGLSWHHIKWKKRVIKTFYAFYKIFILKNLEK